MVKKGDIVMGNFEFKSAICTSVEQSKRLLELGLKKETADMVWMKELAWDEVAHCTYDADTYMLRPIDYLEGESHRGHIPAWSLHRLMEIAEVNDIAFLDISKMYNTCIKIIEGRIYAGLINKDYLEGKK